jgi:hypothetical protein
VRVTDGQSRLKKTFLRYLRFSMIRDPSIAPDRFGVK